MSVIFTYVFESWLLTERLTDKQSHLGCSTRKEKTDWSLNIIRFGQNYVETHPAMGP